MKNKYKKRVINIFLSFLLIFNSLDFSVFANEETSEETPTPTEEYTEPTPTPTEENIEPTPTPTEDYVPEETPVPTEVSEYTEEDSENTSTQIEDTSGLVEYYIEEVSPLMLIANEEISTEATDEKDINDIGNYKFVFDYEDELEHRVLHDIHINDTVEKFKFEDEFYAYEPVVGFDITLYTEKTVIDAEENAMTVKEDATFENPIRVNITSKLFEDIYKQYAEDDNYTILRVNKEEAIDQLEEKIQLEGLSFENAEEDNTRNTLEDVKEDSTLEQLAFTIEENTTITTNDNEEEIEVVEDYTLSFESATFTTFIIAKKEEIVELERKDEAIEDELLMVPELNFLTSQMVAAPLAFSSGSPLLGAGENTGDGYNHEGDFGQSATAPAQSGASNDGITIERLSIKWKIKDPVQGKESNLYGTYNITPETDSLPYMKFQIDYALSGKDRIPAGDIEIIIPAYIWKTRDGREAGLLNLSTKGFEWKRVGNNIVITNSKPLPAATSGFIQGAWFMQSPNLDAEPSTFTSTYAHEIRDVDTVDKSLPYAYGSDVLFAVMNVKTPANNEIVSLESNHINATINTKVAIKSTSKTNYDQTTRTYFFYDGATGAGVPVQLLNQLEGNASDYYFVKWYVDASAAGNQAFTLTMEDAALQIKDKANGNVVSTVNPIMLGASGTSTGVVEAVNNQVTFDLIDGYTTSTRSSYIYMAYKKSELDTMSSGEYTITNTVNATVIGKDDNIATSKSASYSVDFKDYHIKKVWDDNNNAKGKRPTSLSVRFYNSRHQWITKTIDASTNWEAIYWDVSVTNAEESAPGGTYSERVYGSEYTTITDNDQIYQSCVYHPYTITWSGYNRGGRKKVYDEETRTWTFTNIYSELTESRYESSCETRTKYWFHPISGWSLHKNVSSSYDHPELKVLTDRGIRDLIEGKEVVIPYSVSMSSTTAPYTVAEGTTRITSASDYGKRSVIVELEDDLVSSRNLDLTTNDYDIAYVTLSTPSGYGYRNDGTVEPGGYVFDSDWYFYTVATSEIPEMTLYGRREGGQWVEYAKVANDGTVTPLNGATVSGKQVSFPEGANINYVKTSLETKLARVSMGYTIGVRIKPTQKIMNVTSRMLENDDWAIAAITNQATSRVLRSSTELEKHTTSDVGYIHGRNIRLAVDLDKTITQGTNDRANYRLGYNNTITLWQQTNIESSWELNEALNSGQIDYSDSGTFYDLLPAGMTVDESSIKVTSGTIKTYDVIENYKGSGRQLLIVKADLNETRYTRAYYTRDNKSAFDDYFNPSPGTSYIGTKATLTFRMWYPYEEATNRGTLNLWNTAAYEADEAVFGTAKNWIGEEDNPNGTNNRETASAFPNYATKTLMTNLDPNRNDPTFVYASAVCPDRVWLNSGLFSITKMAQLIGDGDNWRSGQEDDNPITVFEGGKYSYQLAITANDENTVRDIILFDSLDNYQPMRITTDAYTSDRVSWYAGDIVSKYELDYENSISQQGVIEAEPVWNWSGSLRSVDVSEIVARPSKDKSDGNCAPVVYYYFEDGLNITTLPIDYNISASNPDLRNEQWTEKLSIANGWYREEQIPADKTLSDAKAIAIDCRKTTLGKDFVLDGMESLIAYVNMKAVTAVTDPNAFDQVDYDNYLKNASAYNAVYVNARATDGYTGLEEAPDFKFSDYTKVNIVGYNMPVEKFWDDMDNNDGMRPDSVEVELYKYDSQGNLSSDVRTGTIVPDANGKWKYTFEHVELFDDDGNRNTFEVKEIPVAEYTSTSRVVNNKQIEITNKHVPIRIDIPFEKKWTSEEEEGWQVNIPRSIIVQLFIVETDPVTGEEKRIYTGSQQAVTPDSQGNWKGVFKDVLKYSKGEEVKYVVDEKEIPEDFFKSVDDETRIITNNYRPRGDIRVQKSVQNGTTVALEKSFTFTLSLTDLNGDPLINKYTYHIYDENDTVVETGEIGNADTFELKNNQYIYIEEIPTKVNYRVVEESLQGFTITSTKNNVGKISSAHYADVAFTNTYASRGRARFGGTKYLTGKTLRQYQFRFDLLDAEGELIKYATNQAPELESDRQIYDLNSADFMFGEMTYTHEDDGKEFTYKIVENPVSPKPGYTYDDTEYTVKVVPHDNGDGTMTCDVKYFNSNNEEITADDILFYNEYHAHGEIELKVFKDLKSGSIRQLQDNEFEFELLMIDDSDPNNRQLVPVNTVYKYDSTNDQWVDNFGNANVTVPNDAKDESGRTYEDYINNSDDPTGVRFYSPTTITAKNDADGNVVFPKIHYDEQDVNKTYYYVIREIKGTDDTVIYDEEPKAYSVYVVDNGDGTLSFTQSSLDTTGMLIRRSAGQQDYKASDSSGKYYIKYGDQRFVFANNYNNSFSAIGQSSGLIDAEIKIHSSETGQPLTTTGRIVTFSNVSISGDGFWFDLPNDVTTTLNNNKFNNKWAGFGELFLELIHYNYPETQSYLTIESALDYLGKTEIKNIVSRDGWGQSEFLLSGSNRISSKDEFFDLNFDISFSDEPQLPDMTFKVPMSFNRTINYYPSNFNNPVLTYYKNTYQANYRFTTEYYMEEVNPNWQPTPGDVPVFENTLKPGDLTITKFANDPNDLGADPNQEFHFRLKLIGDDIEGKDFEINYQNVGKHATIDRSKLTFESYSEAPDTTAFNVPQAKYRNATSFQQVYTTSYTLEDVINLGAERIDDETTAYRIYQWVDTGTNTWYIWSDAATVYLPEDSSFLFSYTNADTIDLSGFNSDRVKSMQGMFRYSKSPSIILTGLNTSNVENMNMMFMESQATVLDVSGLNTSNVTNMSSMFNGTKATEIDVSNFDTSSVTNMSFMFFNSAATSIDVSKFDTSKVIGTSSGYDGMARMFMGSAVEYLDLSSFDTTKAKNMNDMFTDAKVNKVVLGNNFKFKGNNITNTAYQAIFPSSATTSWRNSAKSLTKTSQELRDNYDANASAWSGTWEQIYQIAVYDSSDNSLKFYSGDNARNVVANKTGTQTIYELDPNASYSYYYTVPWYSNRQNIQSVTFVDDIYTNSTYYWFYENTAQTYAGFDKLKGVTNMFSMFVLSNALSLDLSGFDTSNVTNMSWAFAHVNATTITGLNTFDTSKVTDMGHMFYSSATLSLDLSGFNTSNVTEMGNMFEYSKATTITGLNTFDTSKVTNMQYMFNGSLAASLDLSSFDTSKVTNMQYMFNNSKATSLDLSGFNTENVTTMASMFSGSKATSITIGDNFRFKGKNITNTSYQALFPTSTTTTWVNSAKSLTKTSQELRDNYDANASAWAGTWEQLYQIAVYDSSDKSLKFYSGANARNVVANKTGTQKIYELDPSTSYSYNSVPWYQYRQNIQSVTFVDDIYTNSTYYWFYENTAQTYTGFDKLKGVTGAYGMFRYTTAPSLDVRSFDMSAVTNMQSMFYGTQAASINVSGLDTSKVTNMNNVFTDAQATSIIGLNTLDTSSATVMNGMFQNTAATSLDLSNFNTSNVTDMYVMFYGSNAQTLDLSSFDTSKVTSMGDMFTRSKATSLDLSTFDTSNVTGMPGMFSDSAATTIKIGNKFKFKGKNITSASYQALFPTNANTLWQNTAKSLTKTSQELRDNYDANASAWSGTWTRASSTASTPNNALLLTQEDNDTSSTFNNETKPVLGFKSALSKLGLLTTVEAAEGDIYSNGAAQGTFNGMSWKIVELADGTNQLQLGQAGSTQTLTTTTGQTNASYWPWNSYIEVIQSAKVVGPVIVYNSTEYMFTLPNATSVDISNLQTTNVTNMHGMFYECGSTSGATTIIGLNSLNTSNTEKLDSMFMYCKATSLDLSSFNTSNVTTMSGMFYNSAATSLDLSSFDTSKVTTMYSMFYNTAATTITGLNRFSTSNVINMSHMFYGANATNLDVSSFKTSNVTNMEGMFGQTAATTITGLNTFDTSNVTKMKSMFINSSATSLDLRGFKTANAEVQGMFTQIKANSITIDADFSFKGNGGYSGVWAYLGSGDAKWINRSKGLIKSGLDFRDYYDANASAWSGTWERLYQIAVYDSSDKSLKFYSGTNAINVEANLTSTQTKYGPLAVDATYGSYTNVPWYAKRTDIQSVTFVDDIYTNSAAYWFYYNTAQTYSGFDKLKGVTNMSCMFQGSKATSLNLSNFDTSKVTTMYGMFVDSVVSTLDLSSFNTSNVTDMAHMFQGSKATSLDLSNFNTSRVGNAAQMFHDSAARSVTIGPNFKFNSQMLFPDEGFYGAESLWTNSSKSLAKTNIELRDNYNANANEWSGTWVMEGAIAVFKPETGALEFYSLDKETQLRNEAGINGWSVYRVPLNGPDDMRLQPSGDYKTCVPYYAHSPYIKSVSFIDRISPIRMDYWFAGLGSNKISKLIDHSSDPISANEVSFDLAKLDTSNVYSMFNTFSYLLTDNLDLSGFDTSEVWSMREMFANSQATSISFPQNFGSDTRIMYGMFQSFTTTTLDLSSLDTSNAIYMSNMFQYSKATTLDLSSFDTSNVTNMSNMFDGSAATSITLGRNFKFSNNFITDNDYKALFTTPSGNQYTGKWIKRDGLAGPYTPVELRDNYDGSNLDHVGAWVWQLKPPYTIVFNPGEHGTGSMANEQASPDEDYAIPRNSFVPEPAYRFAGWKDNKGNVYELSNLVIPANRFESDETVTLTAQWEDRNTVIKRGEGEYDIYLRNNENVTFKDIPAGTAYQIWEETPSGWVLVKTDIYEVDTNHNYDYEGLTPKSGTSGIIQPTKRHDAQFTNEYDPSKTRVQFNGTKTLDNQFAKEDSFEFELYEVTGTNTETFIEKVAVSEGGLFTFSAIEYLPRDIGPHRYRVKEVVGNDNRINYDTHVEEITVTVVQKDDDTLEATVEYDNDGIVFANTTKPGKLLIKKTAEGLTEDNKNDIFAFKVTLANENGMPLSSGDTINWRIQGSNRASLFNRIASFFTGEDPEVQKATIESVNSAKIAQGDYEGIQWSLTAGGILTLDTNINNELLIEDIFTYEGYPWFNYASKIKAVQYTEVEKENRTGAIETEDNKQAPSLLMKVNADEGNILDSGSFADIDWRIIELADGTNQLQIGNPDGVTQQTISGANDRRDMWPWRMMYDQIDSIKVVGPVNTVNNANIRGLFGMRHDANPAPPVSKVKTIDVTLLDVTNVANIGDMFRNHPALTEIIGYENWNTSKVTDASAAFQDTPNLTEINISNWDMRVVRQSWQMFMGAGQESGITITFGQNCTFETVTNMNRMFQNCGASELDLQYFSMQSVTNSQLANFFYNMNNLKRVRLSEGMWRNSNNNPRNHLSGHLPVSKYDTWKMESDPTVVLTSDYIMRNYTINYHAWGNQWWKWVGVIAIYDSSDGSLKFYDSESSNVPDTLTSTQTLYNARMSGEYGFSVNSLPGWHEHASDIKSVSFVDRIKPINMDFMFADFSNPELTFDFTNLDTSELNYMRGTFYGLTQNSFTFDLPTPRLNSLANTFQNARITNLDFGNHFNTSNVTNMESTFHRAKILNLDLSKWNTSNVTNMHLMFNGFEGPKLDISAFNTSKVTTVEGMLADLQVERLVLGNFKTKQGINNTSFMDSSNILVIEIGPEADLTYLFEESHFGGTYAGQESKWVSQKHPEIGNVRGYNSTGSQSGTMLGYLKEDIAKYHGLWYKSYFVKPKAIYDSRDKSLKFYSGLAALELDLDPNYQTEYEINDTQHGGYPTPNEIPWFSIRENVRYVEIVDEIHIFETDHWFYGFKDVEFKNMSNIKYTLYNPGSATGHSSHNVESMFEGVVADTVDLSGLVTYENAPEVYINMFKNAKIRVLDISDFNLHNAIVNDFFANAEIKEIILGENTTFKDAYVASAGPNFSDNPFQLPTPSTEGTYTGLWVKEDGTKGPLTPEEIAAGYDGSDPAWRGKWIWDGEPSYFTLSFNGNGGVSTQSPVRITALDNTYITIPDGSQVYRIKHNFLGWNTEPDGSGEEYVVGQTYNFADKIGQKMVLYAQWERSEYSDYRVEHYQQNTSLSDYTLVETETIYGEDSHLGGGDSVTPAVKNYPGFISPTPITEIVKDDGSLLVRYYYERMIYTIAYDGNNASSGSMASQTYIAGTNITISDNKENNNDVFKKYRNVFNGWNTEPDGSGTPFAAGFYGDIHPSLFNSNNRLTLYAQWTDISGGQVSPTEGVVYVYAMAGETIEILDLPAGTTYTIEEIDLPNGWILDSKSGEVGTIASNTTSESSFKNKYSATGEGIIELHKRFVGDTLKEDQFSFKIFENDVELDIQNNGALDTNEEIAGLNGNNEANPWYMTGPVEFRIHYTMEDIGVHTYKVVEYVENPDEQIEYDTHEETVVVTVKDSGDGTLLTDVVYQGDALFVNEMKKGSLKLTKNILNATETAKQVEHEFTINIKDAQGNALRDAYPATIYHNTMSENEDVERYEEEIKAIAHTTNISGGYSFDNYTYADYQMVLDANDSTLFEVDKTTTPYRINISSTSLGMSRADLLRDMHISGYYDDTTDIFGKETTLGVVNETTAANITTKEFIENATLKVEYDLDGGDRLFIYLPDGTSVVLGVTNTSGVFETTIDEGNVVHFDLDYGIDPRTHDKKGFYAELTATQIAETITRTSTATTTEETITLDSDRKVKLKGGDYVVVEGLPNGATYEIEETPTVGWELTGTVQPNGTIVAASLKEAEFTNTYGSIGQVEIPVRKLFNGGDLSEEQFRFDLYDNQYNVVDVVYTDDKGNASFLIFYNQNDDGKTFEYQIKEFIPDENHSQIIYDKHIERFKVTVKDNGTGELVATVDYDDDGVLFENTFDGYDLVVQKDISGEIKSDEEYEFEITLYDSEGVDLTDADAVNAYIEQIKTNPSGLLKYTGKVGVGDVEYLISIKTGETINTTNRDLTHEVNSTVNHVDIVDGVGRFTLKGGESIILQEFKDQVFYQIREVNGDTTTTDAFNEIGLINQTIDYTSLGPIDVRFAESLNDSMNAPSYKEIEASRLANVLYLDMVTAVGPQAESIKMIAQLSDVMEPFNVSDLANYTRVYVAGSDAISASAYTTSYDRDKNQIIVEIPITDNIMNYMNKAGRENGLVDIEKSNSNHRGLAHNVEVVTAVKFVNHPNLDAYTEYDEDNNVIVKIPVSSSYELMMHEMANNENKVIQTRESFDSYVVVKDAENVHYTAKLEKWISDIGIDSDVLDLESFVDNKSFTYHLKTYVPDKATSFRIVDDLSGMPGISLDSTNYEATVDGNENILDISITNNSVIATLSEEQLKRYAGTVVEIKVGASLTGTFDATTNDYAQMKGVDGRYRLVNQAQYETTINGQLVTRKSNQAMIVWNRDDDSDVVRFHNFRKEKDHVNLRILKTNEDGSRGLENAEFTLDKIVSAVNNPSGFGMNNGVPMIDENFAQKRFTTLSNGARVLQVSEPGWYMLSEIAAPVGYQMNEGKYYIYLENDDEASIHVYYDDYTDTQPRTYEEIRANFKELTRTNDNTMPAFIYDASVDPNYSSENDDALKGKVWYAIKNKATTQLIVQKDVHGFSENLEFNFRMGLYDDGGNLITDAATLSAYNELISVDIRDENGELLFNANYPVTYKRSGDYRYIFDGMNYYKSSIRGGAWSKVSDVDEFNTVAANYNSYPDMAKEEFFGSDGYHTFIIEANQTYNVKNLPDNMKYKVEELIGRRTYGTSGSAVNEEKQKWYVVSRNAEGTIGNRAGEGATLPEDIYPTDLSISFVHYVNLQETIYKVDKYKQDPKKAITGAEFKLTNISKQQDIYERGSVVSTFAVDRKGKYSFNELDFTQEEAWYLLEETKIPDGYLDPYAPWFIKVGNQKKSTLKQAYLSFIKDTHYVYDEENDSMHVLTAAQRQVIDTSNDIPTTIAGHDGCYVHDNPQFTYCTYPTPHYYYNSGNGDQELSADDIAIVEANVQVVVDATNNLYKVKKFAYYKDGDHYFYSDGRQINDAKDLALIRDGDESIEDTSYLLHPYITVFEVVSVEDYTGQTIGEDQIVIDAKVYTLMELLNYEVFDEETPGFLIENTSRYNLPSSGGIGTYIFTLFGSIVLGLSFLVLYGKKRRKRSVVNG